MFRRFTKIFYRTLDNKEISYKELNKMMNSNKDAILIDVRSKQEYKEGHLENAINIPLYDFENNISKIPNKESTIIVYCASRA